MAVDPVIQRLMDLIEPPDDGDQARPTSNFGSGRSVGTSPHGGFDMNRGHGVQPNGRVTSPVYGRIKEIDPKLGRIVIEERDPTNDKQPTGYDIEILHTQTQTVKKGDGSRTGLPLRAISGIDRWRRRLSGRYGLITRARNILKLSMIAALKTRKNSRTRKDICVVQKFPAAPVD